MKKEGRRQEAERERKREREREKGSTVTGTPRVIELPGRTGVAQVRLVHGLRDKEPQEIPILPYSGTVRSLSRPKIETRSGKCPQRASVPSCLSLKSKKTRLAIRKMERGLWILIETRCARKERNSSASTTTKRAFIDGQTREIPSKTSIRRNIDTPLTLPHPFCAVWPLRSLVYTEIFHVRK